MVASSECRRSGKLGGRVIERASLEDHAARGGMNKKVRQLSTDNKMVSVHQQEVDHEKIIDLGMRIPVLRTPIASEVLTEVDCSLSEPDPDIARSACWSVENHSATCCLLFLHL